MNIELRIAKSIEYLLEQGKGKFVIYPFDNYGRLTKDILNRHFGIDEICVIDSHYSQYNPMIKPLDYLEQLKDYVVLIAIPHTNPRYVDLHREIDERVPFENLWDVLSLSTYFSPFAHYDPIEIHKDVRWSVIESCSREIYKNQVEGSVAEAGVYKGGTARWINRFFPDRKLYLFDSFQGFQRSDQEHDDSKGLFNLKLDYSNTSINEVMSNMAFKKNIIVKAGYFPSTFDGIDDTFCFVRLDMDLYQPILSGLELFSKRMAKGGYILVHDCRSRNFDGARQAVLDYCKSSDKRYVCMPDPLGTAIIPF